MPKHHGITKVRIISLLCFFGLIGSFNLWAELLNSAIRAIASDPDIRTHAPWLERVSIDQQPAYFIVAAGLIVVIAVNYFVRDRSIPGRHPKQIDEDFPEPRFDQKLAAFCSTLEQHLMQTDRQANWSPEFYTELDAEVEIQSAIGSSQRKRVTNLQRAIRSDRETRAFLVLGDPGSGKSVALRKLARDMLKQVGTTGRIPIYINLREWTHSKATDGRAWTEEHPPTFDDLEKFVIDRLNNIGDAFTEQFVAQYFHKLWLAGRLFFLFDSFDEIPDLLDSNEESWLVDSLSTIFNRFITSGLHSRGILASRVFRRPTGAYIAGKILEIRPLTEEGIISALSRHPGFTEEIKIQLFRDRQDLIPIARNPLLASLLGEWLQSNRNLPKNQADLYRNYLINQLKKCQDKIDKNRLTIDDVLDVAQDVAWFVFESPTYGLEAPVQVLSRQMSSPHTDAAIGILNHARIARVTSTEPRSFAFSHRRFLEYFVSTKLLTMPERLPTEHIPTDSRGRDALTLFAQICEDKQASELAELCWKEISAHFDSPEHQLRSIHSLRFLIDAFRSRRTAIASFSSLLGEFMEGRISDGKNLVYAKIGLEATGLLPDDKAIPLLNQAISSTNSWLQETAFRALRQLSKPNSDLENSVRYYILNIDDINFLRNRKTINFALSLSDGFANVKKLVKFRWMNLILSAIAVIAIFMLSPAMFASIAAAATLSSMVLFSKNAYRRNSIYPFFLIFFRSYTAFISILYAMISIIFDQEKNSSLRLQYGNEFVPELDLLQSASAFIIPEPSNAIALLIFGILAFDLVKIYQAIRDDYQKFKGIMNIYFLFKCLKKIRENLTDFSLFLSALVAVLWIIFLLFKHLPEISGAIMIITSSLIILFAIINFVHFIRSFVVDLLIFRKIKIGDNTTRTEIASVLKSLKTDGRRMRYVTLLSERRVNVNGEWPDGFSLCVSRDPIITELAKLEERWLGLDR